MSAVSYPITVFYDASCPLCRREIGLLKAYDAQDKIHLVDCSPAEFAGEGGYTRAAMMRLIHARDASGQWLIGVGVFAAAYEASGFSSVARVFSAPWLAPVWRRIYPWVARHRMLLSKLGMLHVLEWLLPKLHAHSARRAQQQSKGCAQALCDTDKKPLL